MVERWVEGWEASFYSSDDTAVSLDGPNRELRNTSSMIVEFRRRVSALDHARRSTVDKAWFPRLTELPTEKGKGKDNHQVQALLSSLETARDKFDLLLVEIRADMDLLMLQSTSNSQQSADRLQDKLAKVTGLVLVPTLVAGLFGANTALPGQGHWFGFDLMVALMIISALAVYLAIRRVSRPAP